MSTFIPHGGYTDEEWQIQVGDKIYRPSQGEALARHIEELEAENSNLKQQVNYYQNPPYFPEEEGDW